MNLAWTTKFLNWVSFVVFVVVSINHVSHAVPIGMGSMTYKGFERMRQQLKIRRNILQHIEAERYVPVEHNSRNIYNNGNLEVGGFRDVDAVSGHKREVLEPYRHVGIGLSQAEELFNEGVEPDDKNVTTEALDTQTLNETVVSPTIVYVDGDTGTDGKQVRALRALHQSNLNAFDVNIYLSNPTSENAFDLVETATTTFGSNTVQMVYNPAENKVVEEGARTVTLHVSGANAAALQACRIRCQKYEKVRVSPFNSTRRDSWNVIIDGDKTFKHCDCDDPKLTSPTTILTTPASNSVEYVPTFAHDNAIDKDDSSEESVNVPTVRAKRSWYYIPSRG